MPCGVPYLVVRFLAQHISHILLLLLLPLIRHLLLPLKVPSCNLPFYGLWLSLFPQRAIFVFIFLYLFTSLFASIISCVHADHSVQVQEHSIFSSQPLHCSTYPLCCDGLSPLLVRFGWLDDDHEDDCTSGTPFSWKLS